MNENPYENNPQNAYPDQQNAYQNQQQNAYQNQPQYNYSNQPQQPGYPYQQQPVMPAGPMPSQGGYLALVILGFFCGLLWGFLSIGPYNKMKAAIAANDSFTAQENAKKIRTFVIIGIVLNIVLVIFRVALESAA